MLGFRRALITALRLRVSLSCRGGHRLIYGGSVYQTLLSHGGIPGTRLKHSIQPCYVSHRHQDCSRRTSPNLPVHNTTPPRTWRVRVGLLNSAWYSEVAYALGAAQEAVPMRLGKRDACIIHIRRVRKRTDCHGAVDELHGRGVDERLDRDVGAVLPHPRAHPCTGICHQNGACWCCKVSTQSS